MNEQRYALFAGDHYYPVGGADDFIALGGTVVELEALATGHEWAHIADLFSMEVIRHMYRSPCKHDGPIIWKDGPDC